MENWGKKPGPSSQPPLAHSWISPRCVRGLPSARCYTVSYGHVNEQGRHALNHSSDREHRFCRNCTRFYSSLAGRRAQGKSSMVTPTKLDLKADACYPRDWQGRIFHMQGIAWHLWTKKKSGNISIGGKGKRKHGKLRKQGGARDLNVSVRIPHDSENHGSLGVIN